MPFGATIELRGNAFTRERKRSLTAETAETAEIAERTARAAVRP